MKKVIIISMIISLTSFLTWAVYKKSNNSSFRLKKAKKTEFILSDTQRLCINEFLKIQKFYKKNKIFKASLFKSISPEGQVGEQLNVEVFADGFNYLMDSKLGSVVNNPDFFAQINYQSEEILIGHPNDINPLGFDFKDLMVVFKDSLVEVEFKRKEDIATISYKSFVGNTDTYVSYKFLTGEILRITQTYFDYWDDEAEETKITEDCVIRRFEPLNKPINLKNFKLVEFITSKDSVFKGIGRCENYEIIDTRY